ncbi:MAG TPA: NAD-dependent epimerase/dehydratase family protein, partial [Myxococcota bacterium]|nr:NAD-dependent epimerase/dehydratase family protein [Myxococcota bacterium]
MPRDALWRYHANPGAFERLSPPWQRVELVEKTDGIGEGQRLVMKLGRRPFRITWEALHGPMVPLVSFEDTQVRGPFSRWHHVHAFEGDAGRSSLIDTIDWAPPLPPLGHLGGCIVARQIARLFRFRHARTRLDLAYQTRTLPMDAQQPTSAPRRPLRIAITGSSGLVGQALIPYLTTAGHEVLRFVRRAPRDPGELSWDPVRNVLDPGSLDGLDAIVHLAGDSIADDRWSPQKKALIRDSRVLGTKTLIDAIARAERRPPTLVSASAIGFYGLGDEVHTERDGPGDDFLAGVCREWEDEATRAEALGVRVVRARLGVVLDPRGGALNKLVGPF